MCNEADGEGADLTGQHGQEAGQTTPGAGLPRLVMKYVVSSINYISSANDEEIDSHESIS